MSNIPYVPNGAATQSLDLYLPSDYKKRKEPLPWVLFIHGGGWFTGDKDQDHYMLHGTRWVILNNGYAVASVNYRLSGESPFPAQIRDCKTALRFLKAHAKEYGLDTRRIGVWGGSAGGNLASLLGTSTNVPEFETGYWSEQTSQVAAVCDFCGKTDLLMIADDPQREKTPLYSQINQYLGGEIGSRREAAQKASPVFWVSDQTPPFLIVHGTADQTNNYEHARRLFKKLQDAGREVILLPLENTKHDGAAFVSPETQRVMLDFFAKHLKQQE